MKMKRKARLFINLSNFTLVQYGLRFPPGTMVRSIRTLDPPWVLFNRQFTGRERASLTWTGLEIDRGGVRRGQGRGTIVTGPGVAYTAPGIGQHR